MKISRKSRSRRTVLPVGFTAIVAVFALTVVLAPGSAPAATAQAGGSSTVPSAQASGSSTVSIRNFAFHPSTLDVAKGATVRFSNASSTTHTATRAGAFDTGRIQPGKSVSVRFTQKGTFAYHCKIHPFMHGKIVVG